MQTEQLERIPPLDPNTLGVINTIENQLEKIEIKYKEASSSTLSRTEQEKIKRNILKIIWDLFEEIRRHIEDAITRKACMERVLTDKSVYGFHKLSCKQSFGIVEQPSTIPKNVITEAGLVRGKKQGGSANETQQARLKDSGKLVFCKNTHPEVAQLEIVIADFYRHSLDGRTAHGKVIVDEKNKDITGMYVEGIPGFVPMRTLTDLAQLPNPTKAIKEKIDTIENKILKIDQQLTAKEGNPVHLKAERNELINSLRTHEQIVRLKLIDTKTHSVNLQPISGLISKALCTAFFYEDWDRHKDNFGISFASAPPHPGGLGVASLDYDKSLTGIFGQDHKTYDWKITPKLLRDFPNFDCWYWPSSSNKYRKFFSSIFSPKKAPKMYSDKEAEQYSLLKHDEKFKRQSQVEWLKMVFISQELRENSVKSLTNPSCKPSTNSSETLSKVPKILEERRHALLDSLVRLQDFRKTFATDKDKAELLEQTKTELRNALTPEEFRLVEKSWDSIQTDIEQRINRIELLEKKVASLGYQCLIKAIKKTGISFSPNLSEEKLTKTLSQITTSMSSTTIRNLLNKELDLDISEKDANKIMSKVYLERIYTNLPEKLRDRFSTAFDNENLEIKKFGFPRVTPLKIIEQFESLMTELKKAPQIPGKPDKNLQKAMRCLRNLGITSRIISDAELSSELTEHPSSTEEQKSLPKIFLT